jgi:hypothetical protein
MEVAMSESKKYTADKRSITLITDRDTVVHYLDTSPRAHVLLAQRLVNLGPIAYEMAVRDCLPGCLYPEDVADMVRRVLRARIQPRIRAVRRRRAA